jgi:predicted lysophospholipase L1 biosynthesis ABC-type transport system permease subunit
MEKTLQQKLGTPLIAAALIAGIGAGAFALAGAQSAAAADTSTTTTPTAASGTHPQGHAPLGGDGVVASISGTTLTMTEEANEGGATYTVDASNATITKNGAAASLSSIAVGDKIFVKGTVTGTTVVATSINDGHGGAVGHMGHRGTPGSGTSTASP